MSLVKRIAERERGSVTIRDYDIALYRLKCYYDDVYRGVTPNTNAADYNPSAPVFACRFCSAEGYQEIIALANEDGRIALQDTSIKGEPNQQLEGTQAHGNAIFDVAWMPGELKLVTTSGDHTAKLWDISRSEIKEIECFRGHTRTVKTAAFRYQDKAVFATGARDGSVMIWDIRATHNDQPKPDNCISNAHPTGPVSTKHTKKIICPASRSQSVTGLAFQDDFTLVSCAAGDGLMKIWDLRKNYTVHKKEPLAKHIINYPGHSSKKGYSSLLICPARITIYASCMDSVIYAYNISSCNPTKPMAEYYGHQNFSYYVKTCLSPDGRYLASGSSDDLGYIWRTNKPGAPIVRLAGHTDEVTCIVWCNSDETKIVTCSDDSRHKIWRVGYEHKIENEEIYIQGHAEVVTHQNPFDSLKLEKTPTVSRRRAISQERTPSSDNTPGATPSTSRKDACNSSSDSHSHANSIGSSVKRSYSQMTAGGSWSEGKFKMILSPIHENHESAAKRRHLDYRGARRLFSPSHDNPLPLSRGYESDEPSTSTSRSISGTSGVLFSPTSNLPNFVIDGTAPHLLQASPEKCKENVDWLTKIRKERYEQRGLKPVAEKIASSTPQPTSARRNSRSRSTEPQKVTKTSKSPGPGPLRQFLKITAKDCKTNLRCDTTNALPSTTQPEQSTHL